MDGWREYDLCGVGRVACDMMRAASLDLFSELDTPVCFDHGNEFSAGAVACGLKYRHLITSSRDCGSNVDDLFWTAEYTTDDGMKKSRNNHKCAWL